MESKTQQKDSANLGAIWKKAHFHEYTNILLSNIQVWLKSNILIQDVFLFNKIEIKAYVTVVFHRANIIKVKHLAS
jgi:hypothetical protein